MVSGIIIGISFIHRAQRPSNIRLTWEAELAQLLPSEATSKSCDKPLTQVEAIVRILFFYFLQ